jgi:Domain of unknown function (DUF4907)
MQMTRKRSFFLFSGIIIIFGLLVILSILFFTSVKREPPSPPAKGMVFVAPEVFQTKNGWGYNITVNHKIYIHQEFIPAISGYVPFLSKEDAMKTAKLVVEKLSHGKIPSVTARELDSMKISY